MRIHLLVIGLLGCVGAVPEQPVQRDAAMSSSDGPAANPDAPTTTFSFFLTSSGGPNGGDLRRTNADPDGLAGADEICQMKASTAVPAAAAKLWRAYLSTATVNARTRIGTGPWFNVNGVMIATSIDNLHDAAMNNINKATALDENGG